MPPSGFSRKAVEALVQFLEACYEDLLIKVKAKGQSAHAAEEAIQEELDELRAYLRSFSAGTTVSGR